jgi:hypothetical protein
MVGFVKLLFAADLLFYLHSSVQQKLLYPAQ